MVKNPIDFYKISIMIFRFHNLIHYKIFLLIQLYEKRTYSFFGHPPLIPRFTLWLDGNY